MTSTEFNFVDVLDKLQLSEYAEVLRSNGFDSRLALELLSSDDLDAMQITKIGHRKLLLATFAEPKSVRKRRFVTFAPPPYNSNSNNNQESSTSSTASTRHNSDTSQEDDESNHREQQKKSRNAGDDNQQQQQQHDEQQSNSDDTTQQHNPVPTLAARAQSAPIPVVAQRSRPEKIAWSKSFFKRALARDVPYDCDLPVLVQMPSVRLLLVRHGESEANLDHSLYRKIADSAVPLSAKGKEQAAAAGKRIAEYFEQMFTKDGVLERPEKFHCRLWNSCYKRARQTAEILEAHCADWITDKREDILIGEQQFGLFEGCDWGSGEIDHIYPNEINYYRKASAHAGRFWAKVPLGESRMDVCLRVKQFFGTIHRDALRHGITNVVIVSHGVTIRAIMMMWLHLSPEWFELEPNPMNCSIRLIENCMDGGFLHGGHEHPRKDLLLSGKEESTTVNGVFIKIAKSWPGYNESRKERNLSLFIEKRARFLFGQHSIDDEASSQQSETKPTTTTEPTAAATTTPTQQQQQQQQHAQATTVNNATAPPKSARSAFFECSNWYDEKQLLNSYNANANNTNGTVTDAKKPTKMITTNDMTADEPLVTKSSYQRLPNVPKEFNEQDAQTELRSLELIASNFYGNKYKVDFGVLPRMALGERHKLNSEAQAKISKRIRERLGISTSSSSTADKSN